HLLPGVFKARDLVAMATRDAARILKWKGLLGTISAGARADILVIDGMGNPADDPYDALIHAKETAIRVVMINGVARYGLPALMTLLSPDDQTVKVGGQSRKLFLKQATSDPDVAVVSLSKATSQMRDALLNIKTLA